VQIPPFSFSRRLDEPSLKRDDQVFSYRSLRSPPSA
jgi:hypothetical protein